MGGSIPGLEQRSWSRKGSFSIDEGATATPHQKIKNAIGWFQTEQNWVRVHLFWDFLRARPLETCERYWVYLGEQRISAFFLARPSCVSISQELYPPKSYIMWCCNTLLHYFPFQRTVLRDLLIISSTTGIQRQLVISSAAIYSLVRTLTVCMSIFLVIITLERSEGCSCHLLQALNSSPNQWLPLL